MLTISRIVGTGCLVLGEAHRPADDDPVAPGDEVDEAVDVVAVEAGGGQQVVGVELRRGARPARRSPSQCSVEERVVEHGAPGASRPTRRWLTSWNRARSAPTRIWRKRSASAVPRPTSPAARCGFLNRSSPASGSGLIATTRAPRRLASSSAMSIRGWLVPGFWPTTRSSSACVDVVERDGALADADRLGEGRRRSTRGTCSSSRAGCSCRTAGRTAGRGTPPRCSCGRTCRRPPARASWPAARRRCGRRPRPRRSARSGRRRAAATSAR